MSSCSIYKSSTFSRPSPGLICRDLRSTLDLTLNFTLNYICMSNIGPQKQESTEYLLLSGNCKTPLVPQFWFRVQLRALNANSGLGFPSRHYNTSWSWLLFHPPPSLHLPFFFTRSAWKTNGASSSNFRRFRHVHFVYRLWPQPPRSGIYTVGDFMMRKENLHIVKPTTSVNEALKTLVEHRITGFPVIDDDWKLVGVVSDCDLLALDSILGHGQIDNCMFPEVDTTWKMGFLGMSG